MITLVPGLSPIPVHEEFHPNLYAKASDGVLIQGRLGFALANAFPRVGYDVEFILDERTGIAHWSNDHFRGLSSHDRIRVVKREGKIFVEPVPVELIPEEVK